MSNSTSVVVPTHNRATKLRRLLRALDELETELPEEVIVVADRCTDGTDEVLGQWEETDHEFTPNIIIKQTGEGPGGARNLGLLAAKGEIVAFTDDDCIPESKWLRHLTEKLDPAAEVVGVGGRILPLRNDLISRYNTFWRILEPPPSLDYLVSANCCYSRKEATEVGGFDEDAANPGGEDVGLSLKLRQRGWRFEFADTAMVFHDYRNDLKDFVRTFRNYGRGCHRAASRHSTEQQIFRGHIGTRTRPRFPSAGGYGYFGAEHIRPRQLPRDLVYDMKTVRESPLPATEKVSFMMLKIIQRASYSYGWKTA
jgi:glycosyltransferase involved in cell wall biosynthesis